MTLSDLVAAVYLTSTGKVSTLTSSDSDWTRILQLANLALNDWANETGVDWVSLYDPAVSIGTVTATDTFDLDDSIHAISSEDGDSIRIVHTNTAQFTDYDLVAPIRLKHYNTGNYVAQVGATLKFNRAFKSTDAEFGGTIYVPAFTVPDPLASSGDTVPVDDENWLVYAVSAEFVRTDITRQGQYPNLIAKANQAMQKMIENNSAQTETVPLSPVATARTF